eukprot:scaffold3424_cov182-Amphora_coffeaeformis.AAC.6
MYYALVLRYNIREQTLAQRFEPFVHALAMVTPLLFGAIMLREDNYNPTNVIMGWCFINVYPMDCLRRDDIACERGEGYFPWLLVNNLPFFVFFIIVATSCFLTYSSVYQVEERGSQWSLTRSRQSVRRVQETRTQAFLYIAAFAVTYIFFGIGTLLGPSPATREHRNFYLPIVMLIKIFLPLQGFCNSFIYMRPRYAAIRLRHPEMPVWRVLCSVLHSTDERPSSSTSRSQRTRISSIPLFLGLWRRGRERRLNISMPLREGPQETKESSYVPSSTGSGGRFSIVEREEPEMNDEDDYDEFIPEFNRERQQVNHTVENQVESQQPPGGERNLEYEPNQPPRSDREESTNHP